MLNNYIAQGRLTSDPELRTTEKGGLSVTRFTIAVPRDYKNDGKEITDFIDCVAWRNTADFITTYFKKGDLIIINGSVETRSYEDKNGNKRKAVEVKVERAYFSGKKEQNNSAENFAPPQECFTADDTEGLPF